MHCDIDIFANDRFSATISALSLQDVEQDCKLSVAAENTYAESSSAR
jgi:hypothetical protein